MENLKTYNCEKRLMRALYAFIAKEIFLSNEKEYLKKQKDMAKDFKVSLEYISNLHS